MSEQLDRLVMEVSEPWGFSGGPVRLRVLERTSANRWKVAVVSGWSQAREAVLVARYDGKTLLPLQDGWKVVANLTATDRGSPAGLSGTVRADTNA